MENIDEIDAEQEYEKLESFLAKRLYDFNADATGTKDAKYLGLRIRNTDGELIAGVAGHTWHGTCFIGYVWIDTAHRKKGLGTQLMNAVEQVSRNRGCRNIVLSTHSFQSPGFYERIGFRREAEVADHPLGHSNIWLTKPLEYEKR